MVIHFPIALLIVAPLLLVMPAIDRARWKQWGIAGLTMLALGTIGAVVAVMSGEAAHDLVVSSAYADPAGLEAALHEHEELGESTRTVFIILTGMYAGLLLGRLFLKGRAVKVGLAVFGIVFAMVYALGLSQLARTAHEGGLLVHRHGVHAPLAVEPDE